MKVVAVNGSARMGGNTSTLLRAVFEPLQEAGHDCDLIELAGLDVRGCTACGRCRDKGDGRCYGRRDDGNAITQAIFSADAVLSGQPHVLRRSTPE